MTSILVGAYNVEATVNQFVIDQIAATSFSSLFAETPSVITDWGIIAQEVPCYSLIHIPVELSDRYQGRIVDKDGGKGGRQKTILEVSAWTSSSKSSSYIAQLREMRDTIYNMFTSVPTLEVQDYRSTPAAPTDTGYKVNLELPNEVAVLRDENPALYRARLLIVMTYTTRVS